MLMDEDKKKQMKQEVLQGLISNMNSLQGQSLADKTKPAQPVSGGEGVPADDSSDPAKMMQPEMPGVKAPAMPELPMSKSIDSSAEQVDEEKKKKSLRELLAAQSQPKL